jgi:hypothetical protein
MIARKLAARSSEKCAQEYYEIMKPKYGSLELEALKHWSGEDARIPQHPDEENRA